MQMKALQPGESGVTSYPLVLSGLPSSKAPYGQLQFAIRTELGKSFFRDKVHVFDFLSETGNVSKEDFVGVWKSLDDEAEKKVDLKSIYSQDIGAIKKR